MEHIKIELIKWLEILTDANREQWDIFLGYSTSPNHRLIIVDEGRERWVIKGRMGSKTVEYQEINSSNAKEMP
ncbi:MAG: hypothetical protein H6568_00425 [Lewinellaceae bacterium]|nr:hypothetical protein [Saprospiraceae bacterium]MCB9311203.1 hypothetical protein [Lewinellaceae bacterium]HRW74757.1 hypothetical protein [Saprospiraceae bacterium]